MEDGIARRTTLRFHLLQTRNAVSSRFLPRTRACPAGRDRIPVRVTCEVTLLATVPFSGTAVRKLPPFQAKSPHVGAVLCHYANVLPYPAYLRLYQPLSVFPRREREYWKAYAESPRYRGRHEAMAAEHAESLHRLLSKPPLAAPLAESSDAYIHRVGDELLVCPWQTRLRSWLAFSTLQATTSRRLFQSFLPDLVAQETQRDFERWQSRTGRTRPQILTSTWEVPLPWFVLFDAAERHLVLDQAGEEYRPPAPHGGACPQCATSLPAFQQTPVRALLYLTRAADALPRLVRAVRLVSGYSPVSSSFLYALERLEEWVSAVAHPRALLELDYGGLVLLMDDATLRSDQSVAEVHTALTAIEQDRPELVAAMRLRLRTRWNAIRALRHAN